MLMGEVCKAAECVVFKDADIVPIHKLHNWRGISLLDVVLGIGCLLQDRV